MRQTFLKRTLVLVVGALFLGKAHAYSGMYPMGPDPRMTPGSLCVHPDTLRYAERIPYCERDVDGQEKRTIIRIYDQTFGYQIERMDRSDFKIDHFIPLCAGGSNERSNLWPQHKSVYVLTDPAEGLVCQLMQMGKMSQAQAVDTIRRVKADPAHASPIISQLMARLHGYKP